MTTDAGPGPPEIRGRGAVHHTPTLTDSFQHALQRHLVVLVHD